MSQPNSTVEVELSAKQTQMFKELIASKDTAQMLLNTFAAAVFRGVDVEEVQGITLVEKNGTAKLVGIVPPVFTDPAAMPEDKK